jgi:hypothetical protein
LVTDVCFGERGAGEPVGNAVARGNVRRQGAHRKGRPVVRVVPYRPRRGRERQLIAGGARARDDRPGSAVDQRLQKPGPARLALDFDGTVIPTTGMAQATAVFFNPKRKGACRCYALLCTVAQTGQVLDFHHRPGHGHESKGAVNSFFPALLRCAP